MNWFSPVVVANYTTFKFATIPFRWSRSNTACRLCASTCIWCMPLCTCTFPWIISSEYSQGVAIMPVRLCASFQRLITQWSSGTHYILRSSALLCIVVGPDFRKILVCLMNGTSMMSKLHTPYVSIVSHIPCVSVIVNRLGPAAETLAPISSHMASRQPSVVALCSNYYFHHVWFWLVRELPLLVKNTFQVAFHLEIRAKTSCQTKTFELQIPFRSPLVVHRLGVSRTWLLVWLMLGSEPGIMIYHCIYIQVSRFH